MHVYQNSQIIQSTPQEVWALWANPSTWSEWDPEIEKASSESVLRIGSTGKLTPTSGKEQTFKVLLCDPSSSLMLSWQYNMGVEINIKRSWEKVPEGVKITQEVTLIGPMAVFTHRLRKDVFRRMTDTALENLKHQLEGHAKTPMVARPSFG